MRKITTVVFCLFLAVALSTDAAAAVTIKTSEKGKNTATFWLESSLHRVFATSQPTDTPVHLLAARNTRISFQVCLKNNGGNELLVDGRVVDADDLKPRVRLVGFVPMWHHTAGTATNELDGVGKIPGLVPDPLWPITRANAGINETRSFWITLNIPEDAKPGTREIKVELQIVNGKKVELPVELEIASLVVQPRKDFHVIHWWRGEATWDYYKTGMFEDQRWWDITRAQLKDMLDHGSDVVYVPIFFDRRETFKRPCQLLVVNEPTPGKYEFDWSQVKRFVDMSKEIGFKKFEWSHLWIYWGVKNPVRIYTKKNDEYVMLWPPDISGFSDTYTNFLKQFLPAFHDFLEREGVLNDCYFHLSDEPGGGEHLTNYKHARQILRDLAPWMKVMDALSHIEYGREHLTDMPIPMVNSAQAYINEKIPHWVYYCCSPTGEWLNRFMDTPLAKVRMSGFLFYKQGAQGFLHWGYNYWHWMEQEKIGDPIHEGANYSWPGIPYGDPFVIYPGVDGQPMDSIRWEVFAEALQDYAILQTAGIKPDDVLLKDIKTYAKFPKSEEWIDQTVQQLLKPSH